LPRSETPQEPLSTPQSTTEDTHSTRPNPFGAARPVDTDSALKKVEEKLAREKLRDHKEEQGSSRRGPSPGAPADSPAGHRSEKQRSNAKQLLRRVPNNSSAAPSSTSTGSETVELDVPKQETRDTNVSPENRGPSWRKGDETDVAPPPTAEDEVGWETVPARGKKANGVAVKH
jgi:translation initiation factor 4B